MNLSFDKEGFLYPYESIKSDIETIERYFVDDFQESSTRRSLFNNYLKYIHDFQNRVSKHFYQWMNGSFISQKQHPNDIDFVTFFDYQIYESQAPYLDKFWSFSLEEEGLDAYLVPIYPKEHPKYELYQSNLEKYVKLYGQTREDDNGISLPKGFIELNF